MPVEFYRESPGKFYSRILSRTTLSRWTGRIYEPKKLSPPPTSAFPQVEENAEKPRKTKNSLAAGIGGWG